jgi:hypothetical protein
VAPFGTGYVYDEPSELPRRGGCRRVGRGSTPSLEKLFPSGAAGVDASCPRCRSLFIAPLMVFNGDLRGMNVCSTVSSSGPDAPWIACDRCHTGSLAIERIESRTQYAKGRTILKSVRNI